jgi:pyruvate dehydrogenase E1 component alpha subunit
MTARSGRESTPTVLVLAPLGDRDPTRPTRKRLVAWGPCRGPRVSAVRRAPSAKRSHNGAVDSRPGPPLRDVPREQLLGMYRLMLTIRRFEEKAAEMYQRAKIGGYCHLNLGEEATCAGVGAALRPTDYLFTNYREHGYALARGISPEQVMAELFGREDGVSRGLGGSMHLFDASKRLMGGYAIVGGQLPPATGAALALERQGRDEVVLCQMGDGTTNIGAFHESLNLAALWKLPIVYLVVNNGYGMGTPVEAGSAVAELYKKACAYGMPSAVVDGNDPLATRDAVAEALERARSEHTPTLLDVHSFRLKGHSVVDPDRYRSQEYLERIRTEDPVAAFARRLGEAGLLDDAELRRIDEQVELTIDAAVQFADESPEPDPARLFDYSYATPVANQPAALPGEPAWR